VTRTTAVGSPAATQARSPSVLERAPALERGGRALAPARREFVDGGLRERIAHAPEALLEGAPLIGALEGEVGFALLGREQRRHLGEPALLSGSIGSAVAARTANAATIHSARDRGGSACPDPTQGGRRGREPDHG
jgi:hypothetical protein